MKVKLSIRKYQMDWLYLVEQVVAKEKEPSEAETPESRLSTSSGSTCDILEDLVKPEGNLDELETAGLLCVLNDLSLTLNILHARTPDSNLHSSKTSAKRLYEIIEKTISELQESCNFGFLYSTVAEEYIKRRTDARIERYNVENERKIRQLQLEIHSNDKTKLRDINKKQEKIASLKDQLQSLISKSESKIRYVDKWQTAQQDKNMMKCEKEEMKLKWQLESLTNQYNNEITVSDKTCTFLNQQTMDLQAEFDLWKKRYFSELKLRTEKINMLQERARKQLFHLQELKLLFNERLKEMEDYWKFKEERRAEEMQERFINDSATKIQAWWRGTMVRRGLGPYKKRRKTAKDKKKREK